MIPHFLPSFRDFILVAVHGLGMAVKRSHVFRSMLELFATAQEIRDRTLNSLAAVYAVGGILTGSYFQ